MVSPSYTAAQSRSPTRRDPLARYRPRSFSQASRWRFVRDRRALYLARIQGELTEAQKSLIDAMVELEWSALRAEASDDAMIAFREGRQLRREFLRATADFEKALIVQPRKLSPQEALAAIHEQMRQHRDEAA